MEARDNETFNQSLNNIFSDLDQTIHLFEPEDDCRWYIGRKLIASGWCDVYQVKTHANTLSERLIDRLEKHYLADHSPFEYVNIEAEKNGCLVARFYMLANSANIITTKVAEVDTILPEYSEPKNVPMLTGGIMTDIKDTRLSNLLMNLDALEHNFYLYLVSILYKRIITEARRSDFQIGVQSSELTYLSRVFEAVQVYFLDYCSVSITITIFNTDHGMLNLKINFQEINVQKTVEENMYMPTLDALNNISTPSVKIDRVSSDEPVVQELIVHLIEEKLDELISKIEQLKWLWNQTTDGSIHQEIINKYELLIRPFIDLKCNVVFDEKSCFSMIEKLQWLMNNQMVEDIAIAESIKNNINLLISICVSKIK